MKQPKRIVFANLKGGVGKTMVIYQISGYLSERGYRVLCIDIDAQNNLTKAFLGKVPNIGLYEVLTNKCSINEVIKQPYPTNNNLKNIYLIPATYDLFYYTDSNLIINDDSKSVSELKSNIKNYSFTLNNILNNTNLNYDIILIDTNPYISLTSTNAFIAGDSVIGILDASTDSIDGLKYLESIINEIQTYVKPSLSLKGIVLNNNEKRTNFSDVMLNTTKKLYGDKLFKTIISPATVNKESRAAREPLIEYRPKHLASIQFADLTAEFIRKVGI